MNHTRQRSIWASGLILVLALAGCNPGPQAGSVQDEARLAGRAPTSFPAADEDYFHAMDGGISLTADEIKGRNMWIVWTGGDDKLWDTLTVTSVGTVDLLKTLSSSSEERRVGKECPGRLVLRLCQRHCRSSPLA